MALTNHFSDLALSPDGKKIAFVAHGQVFAAAAKEESSAFRVTHSDGAESDLAWAPDSKQLAYVSDRGLWHRVRIGPFKTKLAAAKYKDEFETKERMTAFLVDPDRVKRMEDLRASKLASRAGATEQ